jgi:hypothetical protein
MDVPDSLPGRLYLLAYDPEKQRISGVQPGERRRNKQRTKDRIVRSH